MRNYRWLMSCMLVAVTLLVIAPAVHADSETAFKAVVEQILDERESNSSGVPQVYQQLRIRALSGELKGTALTVEQTYYQNGPQSAYEVGDRIWVTVQEGISGQPVYLISGPERSSTLYLVALVFVALVVFVAQGRGIQSLLGLAISFAVVLLYVMPKLSEGASPIGTALVGGLLSMPINYYLSHGFNRKTTIALMGSLLGLGLTAVLAENLISATHLTGLASDEAGFLLTSSPGSYDLVGILLAGVLVSMIGVLDDVTVAQSAVVEQLASTASNETWRSLYWRAMSVGKDHITSMVNTLMLVYAGASLPLLLLISDQALPLGYVLSQEIVAEEVMRMLVSSIGVIAVVPVTTVIAALFFGRQNERLEEE